MRETIAWTTAAGALVAAVFLAVVVGCASARDKAITTSFYAVEAVDQGWHTWEQAHQQGIYENAKKNAIPRETAEAEVARFRQVRAPVDDAILAAYKALAVAAADKSTTIGDLAARIADLKAAIDKVKADVSAATTPAPTTQPAGGGKP